MFNELTSTRPGAVLMVVGAIPTVIGLVWGVVIGFYPSQLPALVGLLLVGLALMAVGQRMYDGAKRTLALQRIAERDAAGEGR